MGEPVKVTIDDRLPYVDEKVEDGWIYYGSLLNTNMSPNGAWWVPLAEKAFAKYFVNYENMDGGNMVESMSVLTGMPTKTISSDATTDDQMWDYIKSFDDKNWVMAASDIYPIDGLPGGHAYTVLGAQKLNDESGNLVAKMVKMRNPWGSEVYTGDWYDGDSKWTQFYKDQLNHTSADDGVFWMPIASFRQDFTDVQVAMYEDWKKTTNDETWNREGGYPKHTWSLSNPADQDVVIDVEMYSDRLFPYQCSVSAMQEMLQYTLKKDGKIITDDYGLQQGLTSYPDGQNFMFFSNLPAGEYEIEMENSWYMVYHTGKMPYRVLAYGLDQKLPMSLKN